MAACSLTVLALLGTHTGKIQTCPCFSPCLTCLTHLSLSLFLSPREEQEAEYILNPDLVFPLSPWRSVH